MAWIYSVRPNHNAVLSSFIKSLPFTRYKLCRFSIEYIMLTGQDQFMIMNK